MKKIRLGVLGATRGLNYGISAKKCGLPVELAAVCDIFTPLMEKVRARLPELGLNPEYFSDFTEMLNKADIDAVVIANSANDHARFSIAALNAGKHVLSELLPVQTLSEAVALIEAVERSGKVYYYAENYCFWPGILEAVRLFREGMIGDLICGECDFVNDLAARWHLLTRGIRGHWRNYVPSTYYCTHSIGPMLFALREHPVRVTGFEVPNQEFLREHGARCGCAAMEIMQLANGVPLRSTHGNLRRPWEISMRLTGTKGSLEAGHDFVMFDCPSGDCESPFQRRQMPIRPVDGITDSVSHDEVAMPLAMFLGQIWNNPELLPYNIDVFQALDMALPGILAYRSILNGNIPVAIPDFREKTEREEFRHDNICTDPGIASGADLLPSHSFGEITVPDQVYEKEAARLEKSMKEHFKLGFN